MRTFCLTLCLVVLAVTTGGCGAQEQKKQIPVLAPEQKAKLDAQHAAVTDANKKNKNPNQAYAPAAAAPTAGGHGRK
ncbi:MAG: hypothetical protein V4719_02000 [Planctomycetota bacterium]